MPKRKRVPTLAQLMPYWLKRCEALIAKHSTAPRVRGKYAGHSSTNSQAWVSDLARELTRYIRARNVGIGYDENMALASCLGMVLTVWYCEVRRAKSYDLNRPLALRRKANKQVAEYRAQLYRLTCDDELMGKVWAKQPYNFPYGLGASGGTFV